MPFKSFRTFLEHESLLHLSDESDLALACENSSLMEGDRNSAVDSGHVLLGNASDRHQKDGR